FHVPCGAAETTAYPHPDPARRPSWRSRSTAPAHRSLPPGRREPAAASVQLPPLPAEPRLLLLRHRPHVHEPPTPPPGLPCATRPPALDWHSPGVGVRNTQRHR